MGRRVTETFATRFYSEGESCQTPAVGIPMWDFGSAAEAESTPPSSGVRRIEARTDSDPTATIAAWMSEELASAPPPSTPAPLSINPKSRKLEEADGLAEAATALASIGTKPVSSPCVSEIAAPARSRSAWLVPGVMFGLAIACGAALVALAS